MASVRSCLAYLISGGDPSNPPPAFGTFQTGQVALLESQIGKGWEVVAASYGSNHLNGVDNVRWDAVGIVLGHQVLPRGGGWRVDVTSGGGVLLD